MRRIIGGVRRKREPGCSVRSHCIFSAEDVFFNAREKVFFVCVDPRRHGQATCARLLQVSRAASQSALQFDPAEMRVWVGAQRVSRR